MLTCYPRIDRIIIFGNGTNGKPVNNFLKFKLTKTLQMKSEFSNSISTSIEENKSGTG